MFEIENHKLLEKLNINYEDLYFLFLNFNQKHPNTASHCLRVSNYSKMIGKSLSFTKMDLLKLELSALFHDIGKKQISDIILHKPNSLTDLEFEEIKKHTEYSVDICKYYFDQFILNNILYHHEDINGTGYYGLSKDEIPTDSQIIRICDSFDAITSNRCYKSSTNFLEGLNILINDSKHQYNKDLVKIFSYNFI